VERLGIAMSGQRRASHWSEPGANIDFYDIKGIVETLIPEAEFSLSQHSFFAPGIQADILVDSKPTGLLGSLSEEIREMLDVDDDIYVLEIALSPVIKKRNTEIEPLPKFPSTWRDLSLVAGKDVSCKGIKDALSSKGIKELKSIEVVDVYEGEKLPEDKKGITLRITYQSADKTLNDKAITRWQKSLLETLEKDLHISLR
jgi:phenylalanyl-tRNA synthetase beta chain